MTLRYADPSSNDFTLTIVKISRDHAPCTRPKLPDFNVSAETVTFQLAAGGPKPTSLHVWYSNFERAPVVSFESKGTIAVASDGSFTLDVNVGDVFTVTTIATGKKGTYGEGTPSAPQFPLP